MALYNLPYVTSTVGVLVTFFHFNTNHRSFDLCSIGNNVPLVETNIASFCSAVGFPLSLYDAVWYSNGQDSTKWACDHVYRLACLYSDEIIYTQLPYRQGYYLPSDFHSS
jgi:hypothetical protein